MNNDEENIVWFAMRAPFCKELEAKRLLDKQAIEKERTGSRRSQFDIRSYHPADYQGNQKNYSVSAIHHDAGCR